MEISIFGCFLILCLFYIFFINGVKQRFSSYIVLLLFMTIDVNMGYFIKKGDSFIHYDSIIFLFGAIVSLLSKGKTSGKIQTNIFEINQLKRSSVLMLCCIAMSILTFYFYRYSGRVVQNSDYEAFAAGQGSYDYLHSKDLKLGLFYIAICFCVIMVTIRRLFEDSDIVDIARKFISLSFVVLFIGYLEFLCENIFGSLTITNFTITLFGEAGAQQKWLVDRDGLSPIQAMTKEASMFSLTLLYTALIAIGLFRTDTRRNNVVYKVYTFLSVLLLILNRSMSSFIYVFIVIYYIIKTGMIRVKFFSIPFISKLVVIVFLCIILMLFSVYNFTESDNYFLNRVGLSLERFAFDSTLSQYDNSSEGIRFLGIAQCINVFLERPLFGTGIGAVVCVSGIFSMLAGIGLIGTIAWYLVQIRFCGYKFTQHIIDCLIILVLPNLFLNDFGTMYCLAIPFALFLLTKRVYKPINA